MTIEDLEIDRLRDLSDEALLAEIGRDIARQEKGGVLARPPSFRQLTRIAKDWLEYRNEQIRLAVCRDQNLRTLAQSEGSTREQIFKIVADVLGGLAFYVPIGTVAEILVRRGLPSYCDTIWKSGT